MTILIGLIVIIQAVFMGYDVGSLEVFVASLTAGQFRSLAVGLRYDLEIPIAWPTSKSFGLVGGRIILPTGPAIGGQILLETLD